MKNRQSAFHELCVKLFKFSGLFYKLRSILTTAQLLVTYKVYVQPILNYGVLVYGTSSKTILTSGSKNKANCQNHLQKKKNRINTAKSRKV